MNILIYENNLNGHRLEYIHHIYDLALKMPQHHFFFVLADRFNDVKAMFRWQEADNITIELFTAEDVQPIGRRKSLAEIRAESKLTARNMNVYIDKYSIDRIFAITIILYIPYLCHYLRKGVTIDGILYNIFPLSQCGFPYYCVDYVKYGMFRFSSRFVNVYVLNDKEGAAKLNYVFGTSKFKYIPDPFTPLISGACHNLRNSLRIANDKTVFLHFGGLQQRKGTMLIMDSIRMLTPEERSKYVFLFAGKVYNEMRQEFYEAYNELKNEVQIVLKDEFCSYDYLAALCETCDSILIPYLTTTQSSGLIGYASQFQRPVIAPKTGLIGRLVRTYSLGYMLPETSATELVKAYGLIASNKVPSPTTLYCKENSILSFQSVLKSGFSNH